MTPTQPFCVCVFSLQEKAGFQNSRQKQTAVTDQWVARARLLRSEEGSPRSEREDLSSIVQPP